ncbi:MAG: alanine racemase [Candidatus Promineifilaceae bacterium]
MIEPSSWIKLSESAYRKNLRFLRRHVGKNVTLCSIVKANAYGHGVAEFVPMAEGCGVRQFGVFSAEEAAVLQGVCTAKSDIMIMGDLEDSNIGWAVENGFSFWVYDLGRLEVASRAAARCGRPARVHLEVETGMYRLGLSARSLGAAARRILREPERLRLEGVCTHFAGAESAANIHRIEGQFEIYQKRLQSHGLRELSGFKRHMACSAAAFSFPSSIGDMVRFGIAQYGYWPSQETRLQHKARGGRSRAARLYRVLSWHSRLFNIKSVPAGKFVGYGNSYLTNQKTQIAAVPVGYHHGLERSQSNLGHVLVRGLRCPIVGIINMNMMSVDVTHVPGVRVGDEVVLIGCQGEDEITVGAFGSRTNDLNYETLARLHGKLKRIVVA